MAVEAERLLVSVRGQGADSVERGLNGVTRSAAAMGRAVSNAGDRIDSMARSAAGALSPLQAIRSTADSVGDQFSEVSRASGRASRGLTTVAGAAIGATGPMSLLNSRLNETDQQLDRVRNSALGASGAMNTYSGSSLAAAAASYTMHDAIIAGAIPSLIVLLSTLGPLVATVGALTAGLLGLAGGFGIVIGTGALAWFRTTEDAMGQLQQVLDELIAIGTEFGMQFIPLIEAAIGAVPELAQRLVDATGDMTPFVNELLRLGSAAMDVLPRILGWFMDIGREALPVWRDFTNWIGTRTPDALEFFRSVVSRTWDSLHSLTLALLDALATFTEFGVVATNVVGPMLERILGGFEGLLEWVMALPEPIRSVTVAAAALAPVFTIGAVAAAELMRIISGLSGTFTRSNSAIARLTPSLATMAKGLTALAGVAALLHRAYQTNFAGVRDEINRVISVARDEFIPTWNLARDVIGPILSDLAGMFTLTGDQAESALGRIVTMVADQLVVAIRTAGPIIREQLRALDTWWNQHGQTVTSTITEVVWAVQGMLVSAVQAAVPVVRNLITTFLNFRSQIRGLIPQIISVGLSIGQQLVPTLQNLYTQAVSVGQSLAQQLVPALRSAWNVAQSFITRYITAENVVLSLAIAAGTLAARVVGLFNPFTMVAGAVRSLIPLAGSLLSTLSAIPAVIGAVISRAGGLITRLGAAGLRGSLLRLVTLIPTLVTSLGGVTSAILALSGPIGVAIAVAGGLYAAWRTNFLGVRDLTNRVMAGIRTTMQGDMSAVQSTINIATNAINNLWRTRILPLWQLTQQAFGEIRRIVGNVMTWIWRRAVQPALAGITSLYQTHGAEISQEILETYEAIRGYIEPALKFLGTIIGGFLTETNKAWSRWGDEIMTVVNFTMDTIGNVIKIGADFLITTFLTALNLIQGDWEEAWNEIAGFFSRTLDEIMDWAGTWGGRLLDWLGGLVGDVIGWFQSLYQDLIGGSIIPNMLSDIMSALEGFGSDALSWLSGMVSDFLADVRDWGSRAVSEVEDLASDALSALTNLKSDFSSAGGDLISEFASGIRSSAGEAVSAAKDAVSDVRDHFPFSPAETGPLDDIDETGPSLIHEFAGGIWSNLDELRRAASDAAQAAHPEVGSIQPDLIPPEALGAMASASGGGSGNVYIEIGSIEVPDASPGAARRSADTFARRLERESHSWNLYQS